MLGWKSDTTLELQVEGRKLILSPVGGATAEEPTTAAKPRRKK
jgi:hypothetical protein